MKILEINSVCGTGSTGRIACQIAEVVVQNGGESKVAYGRDYYSKGCNVPTFRFGSDFGIILHAGLSRITDRQGFYSKRATLKLISFIDEYNPDIIHLHNLHGYYLNISILFSFIKKLNKQIVLTLHDCWAFTGHCTYFDFSGCNKWIIGCNHCPQKKKYPKSFICDQSNRNWEEKKKLFSSVPNMTIVTPSHWLARLVEKSFLKKYPTRIIHNGVDLKVFKPTPSTWKKQQGIKKPVILACAAQWGERKGLRDVLQIAELLPYYQLVIVGISKQQARSLPASLIGIQRTENVQKLVELYSAADVFINPTYEDNFPTVNLEAIACGTPVVTYNTGGSPETLFNDFGKIITKGDYESLAMRVKDIVEHEKFPFRSLKGFEELDIINANRSYYNLFNELLKKPVHFE